MLVWWECAGSGGRWWAGAGSSAGDGMLVIVIWRRARGIVTWAWWGRILLAVMLAGFGHPKPSLNPN